MRKLAIPAMGAAAMLALSAGTLAAQDTAGAPPPPADAATGTAGTQAPGTADGTSADTAAQPGADASASGAGATQP